MHRQFTQERVAKVRILFPEFDAASLDVPVNKDLAFVVIGLAKEELRHTPTGHEACRVAVQKHNVAIKTRNELLSLLKLKNISEKVDQAVARLARGEERPPTPIKPDLLVVRVDPVPPIPTHLNPESNFGIFNLSAAGDNKASWIFCPIRRHNLELEISPRWVEFRLRHGSKGVDHRWIVPSRRIFRWSCITP